MASAALGELSLNTVATWLEEMGLQRYQAAFEEAEIDFEVLKDLEEEDLRELGLPIGPRRKIWTAIKQLKSGQSQVQPVRKPAAPPEEIRADTPPPSEAERRHMTVMFVDLVGSTEMTGRVDPEDMRHLITNYQSIVARVVKQLNGYVAKYMGDGVLCYFGWPKANEDDAERAVRAGLAMIEEVAQQTDPDGVPLATRVGIATGIVVVGDLIGSGAAQEANGLMERSRHTRNEHGAGRLIRKQTRFCQTPANCPSTFQSRKCFALIRSTGLDHSVRVSTT